MLLSFFFLFILIAFSLWPLQLVKYFTGEKIKNDKNTLKNRIKK